MPWRTGGWNAGKNVGRMLEISVEGRQGGDGRARRRQRLWDLAERRYPLQRPRLSGAASARRCSPAAGVAGIARRGTSAARSTAAPPGVQAAVGGSVREGVALPAEIDGVGGVLVMPTRRLRAPFRPAPCCSAPFDRLVSDRDRAAELFGFRYRLEIYVPVAKREYGYYVLPILHGDRLIGRIDPDYDRRPGSLAVSAVYAEPEATAARRPRRRGGDRASWPDGWARRRWRSAGDVAADWRAGAARDHLRVGRHGRLRDRPSWRPGGLQTGQLYHEFLRRPSMSLGLYVLDAGARIRSRRTTRTRSTTWSPGRADHGRPARRTATVAPGLDRVRSGTAVEHRFHDIDERLELLVVFAPAETG